jgi:hypothetical protein
LSFFFSRQEASGCGPWIGYRKGGQMSKRKLDSKGEKAKENDNLVTMRGKRDAAANEAELATKSEAAEAAEKAYKGAKKALRKAVKAEVKKQSEDIARKLVSKASSGDMHGTEMVLSVMKIAKAEEDAKKKKKRDGPSWAELLVSEPEWDESMEDGKDGEKAS